MASTYILVLIALGSVFCFNDEVEAECGGLIEATSGVISSPSYPSKYPPNHRCIWEIKMPANSRIGIRFRDFRMQGCYNDYVIIRSRSKTGSILQQWEICKLRSDTILTGSNNVLIEFLSDSSVEYEGFELEFFTVFSQCGGLIEEGTGALTTPKHPSNYPSNANCTWTLQAPLNHTIQFNFVNFYTERNIDYVTVMSKTSDGNTKEHGNFSGYGVPPAIISESNILLVQFVSDGSREYSGFLASFSFVLSECGGLVETSSGAITTPRALLQYPRKANCTWTIQAPLKHSIKLDFEKFHLSEYGRCQRDYVSVKSKMADGDIREHGRFCGTTAPSVIISESNVLLVQIVSNYTSQYPEFQAVYSSEGCGGLIKGGRGNISTPFFPISYPPNKMCDWTISVPSQHKLKMRFLHFDIESDGKDCSNDFVLIQTKTADGEIYRNGKYCGNSRPPSIYTRDSILLKFVSDRSVQKGGFKVEYIIDKLTDFELSTSTRKSAHNKLLTVKKNDEQKKNRISRFEANSLSDREISNLTFDLEERLKP